MRLSTQLFAKAGLLTVVLLLPHFSYAANAIVELTVPSSNLCLDVRANATSLRKQLDISICNSQPQQQFSVSANGDGTYTFVAQNSGLCLEQFEGSAMGAGGKIDQNACNGSSQQKFLLNSLQNVNFYSLSSSATGMCITAAKVADGTLLTQQTCARAPATGQAFQFNFLSGALPSVGGSPFVSYPADTPVVPSVGAALPAKLKGINLSGGESNSEKANASYGKDYIFPNSTEIDYYASKGMTVIRLPFTINRLQPVLNQPLDTTQLALIDKVVQYANTKGIWVILDPHNYGYMNDANRTPRLIGVDPLMPATNLADFWSRLAHIYAGQPNVIFNLMNEPHDQTAQQWKNAAVSAINAIRLVGAKQLIMVPGSAWDSANTWQTSGNADAWLGFSESHFVYEVHQYIDITNNASGFACGTNAGSERLLEFERWARGTASKGFLGETGWSSDPTCVTESTAFLSQMESYSDVWTGIAYWDGGPWSGSYEYSIEPLSFTAPIVDKPQMSILETYIQLP